MLATRHSAIVGDAAIHYRQWGDPDAPAVLLLHGGGSNGATWDRLAAAPAGQGLRAIAADLRGHGRSSRSARYRLADHAADAVGLLDALSLPNVRLVGHSLGAYVASLVAQWQPTTRVIRLVLEEPPAPNPHPGTTPSSGLTRSRILLLAAGSVLRRRRYGPRALMAAVTELRRPDPHWWSDLASITAPTLVISGGPRSHIAPQRLEQLVQALPDARLETIPVGHRVHSRAPDRFIPLVTTFLTAPAPAR